MLIGVFLYEPFVFLRDLFVGLKRILEERLFLGGLDSFGQQHILSFAKFKDTPLKHRLLILDRSDLLELAANRLVLSGDGVVLGFQLLGLSGNRLFAKLNCNNMFANPSNMFTNRSLVSRVGAELPWDRLQPPGAGGFDGRLVAEKSAVLGYGFFLSFLPRRGHHGMSRRGVKGIQEPLLLERLSEHP